MPTFDTPEPISVVIDVVVGDVAVTASHRDDTIVEVRPNDPSHEPDARAAEQTRVEYSMGRLLVKAPKQKRAGLFGKVGSIEVTVEVPNDSHLRAHGAVAALRCAGRLGVCQLKTGAGDIQLDHASALDADTGAGAITVGRVLGHTEVRTGTGKVRLRDIDGAAVIRNSNGVTWIGSVTGDLRVKSSNGDIVVDHASGDVTGHTANGDVRVGGMARGAASLKTSCGEIEIGIPSGVAAHLDAHTHFGRVHNQLEAADSPQPSDESLDVLARTSYGDIVIRRSHAPVEVAEP